MRNDVSVARTPAIMLAAASGASLILYVLTAWGGGSPAFHAAVYPILLIVLGYIVSSFAFSEIHDPRTGAYALSSPGSLLEKYVAKVLLTSIGWTVAVTAAYMATTALGAGITRLIFGTSHGIFVPAGRVVWEMIGGYLISQSIFVFGSIYFRKAAFLKTVLAGTVISILFAIFFVVAWRVVYWGEFVRFWPSDREVATVMSAAQPFFEWFERTGERIFDVIGWIVVPLFFWVAGYLRLRETEV
jgi:hypothetical protein